MIRLDQLRLPLSYTEADLARAVAARLGVAVGAVRGAEVVRLSVDARHKPRLEYAAGVIADLGAAEAGLLRARRADAYRPSPRTLGELRLPACARRAVVVGSGPAGMFAALALAVAGARPLIVERGSDVETRRQKVAALRSRGTLDPECNVQFGEGGAGTFSDGKLNTGTNGEYARVILGELVRHGAPPEIEILAKPHVGTDRLFAVVGRIRAEIERLGGRYLFDTRMTGLVVRGGRVAGVVTEGAHAGAIDAEAVLLGVGHSARDTYRMLASAGAALAPKPFAVGVRAEHLQSAINFAQYGRGVYTFCMCPGGEVVCSASEAGGVVTNGMSEYARAGVNANAAVLVGVDGRDFGEDLFAGVEFQRRIERAAFAAGGGGYRAPAQRYEDFAAGRVGGAFGRVRPSYLPGTEFADLRALLPATIADALAEGIAAFGRKLRGFDDPDTVLTGPETRTSAPIRILRDERGESNLRGLFPIGEGAGYAGGIMSAAADGLKTAIRIIEEVMIGDIVLSARGAGLILLGAGLVVLLIVGIVLWKKNH